MVTAYPLTIAAGSSSHISDGPAVRTDCRAGKKMKVRTAVSVRAVVARRARPGSYTASAGCNRSDVDFYRRIFTETAFGSVVILFKPAIREHFLVIKRQSERNHATCWEGKRHRGVSWITPRQFARRYLERRRSLKTRCWVPCAGRSESPTSRFAGYRQSETDRGCPRWPSRAPAQ